MVAPSVPVVRGSVVPGSVRGGRRDWRGWKFMLPFAVVFVFVFIVPIVYAVWISFFQKKMIGGTVFVGFANYARLFADVQFWDSVRRVALFTVVQVPIMLFLAAAMALALDSMKLHGSKFFRISTFLPYAVPAVVSTLIWGFVYGAKYGLVGSLNGLLGTDLDVLAPSVLLAAIGNIVTWEFTGYNMLIFYSSLSTIPHSLYEAAAIDGAGEWQIVRRIKLPELKGSLAITVIFSIIGSFQLFNEPSILQNMVPGNAVTTYYTPNMYAYNLSFSGNQSNYAAALAIVMAVITMAIAYAVQLRSMREQMK
ncbi:carbohydrate ABC transporter permease [Bifidobacterium psychraerophilum]|jgi:multiple sugar transport system permease protein|uniref:carbohydrate ABC transporter permease n=1 Tax=Bifidobacterium psychraerophilum TaxID=218140 RepID=UPI0023EFC3C6|nr:sugar ABC transporter permease [Bifidobacterium psychraerophilum]MCI1805320.1 sugar ABC transporter permease [Bifidobacterium psychraerophilum]MCI2176442.1 sugar ABC transporter permease [Bifidobacterium psychraerophilum]MCI2181958.1 sugar ABC transporter permease [Bifidobacterium psychraerophilum]